MYTGNLISDIIMLHDDSSYVLGTITSQITHNGGFPEFEGMLRHIMWGTLGVSNWCIRV